MQVQLMNLHLCKLSAPQHILQKYSTMKGERISADELKISYTAEYEYYICVGPQSLNNCHVIKDLSKADVIYLTLLGDYIVYDDKSTYIEHTLISYLKNI